MLGKLYTWLKNKYIWVKIFYICFNTKRNWMSNPFQLKYKCNNFLTYLKNCCFLLLFGCGFFVFLLGVLWGFVRFVVFLFVCLFS